MRRLCCFNIRSFGSNCSASLFAPFSLNSAVSISALSDRIAQLLAERGRQHVAHRFNIRSFGSNCSATSTRPPVRGRARFQYPLFRIELLSAENGGSYYAVFTFQYPLFRIELLSVVGVQTDFVALTFQYPLFRIELLSYVFTLTQFCNSGFNIRSFGSNCSALIVLRLERTRQGFNIRSFGSNCSAALASASVFASVCFNIRSFGSNCSAMKAAKDFGASFVFQYPLFRIELLSKLAVGLVLSIAQVSISALSDRIAQLAPGVPPVIAVTVSISALSDRIAQRMARLTWHRASRCFNIRSFGSNCSAPVTFCSSSAVLFQYPLFRIELLSPVGALAGLNNGEVSISALSDRIAQQSSSTPPLPTHPVSISALSDRIAQRRMLSASAATSRKFQYPLFRIELLSRFPPSPPAPPSLFQYPLFRIELLSDVNMPKVDNQFMFQYPLFRIELLSLLTSLM